MFSCVMFRTESDGRIDPIMNKKSIALVISLAVIFGAGCIIAWFAHSQCGRQNPSREQPTSPASRIATVSVGKVISTKPIQGGTRQMTGLSDKLRDRHTGSEQPSSQNKLEPVPKQPDWVTLPSSLKLIAGQAEDKGLDARLIAVHNLGKSLSPKEIEALYWFLGNRLDGQFDLDNLSFNAIKNDILDVLVAQNNIPPDLGAQILQFFRDKTMDVTWRDYCVQHFSTYYETKWGWDDSTRLTMPERVELMRGYDEALAEPENGIAGAALVGLERLSTLYPEINRQQLGEKALKLAKDGRSDIQTRIAAINVCRATGAASILPIARINAQTAEVLPLRLASIAAIGQVGTAEDRELLESLLAGTDNSVHKAASTALKNLGQR